MATYVTKCGGIINVSPRVKNHLQAHPQVFDLLRKAVELISLPTSMQKYEGEIDFGRVIGRSGVTRTPLLGFADYTCFAVRKNRTMPSRVAPLGQVGEETTKMVVLARPTAVEKQYDLITAWIGTVAKKEPWDPSITSSDEFSDCLRFWSSHALVYDPDVMTPVVLSSWADVLVSSKWRFSQE